MKIKFELILNSIDKWIYIYYIMNQQKVKTNLGYASNLSNKIGFGGKPNSSKFKPA